MFCEVMKKKSREVVECLWSTNSNIDTI